MALNSLPDLNHFDIPREDTESLQAIIPEAKMVSPSESELGQVNSGDNSTASSINSAARTVYNRPLSGGWSQSSGDKYSLK